MNKSNKSDLDHLLDDWASKRASSKGDLMNLRRRIVEQLECSQAETVKLPPTTATRHFAATCLAATAAVLLVAFGVWRYQPRLQPSNNPSPFAATEAFESPKAFQAYWPKHLFRQQRLLTEYREVFGQGVSWVTETEQGCDVGLTANEVRDFAPSEYIVVQLWLVARNQRNGKSKVHTINVLAGREEWVEIPDSVGGRPLVLWAHPIDKEMIAIDLRYQVASTAEAQIDSSHLQRVGQVTNIHSFEHKGIEYQLYQTADLLDADDLG